MLRRRRDPLELIAEAVLELPPQARESKSVAQCFALIPQKRRRYLLGRLNEDQAHALIYSWKFRARPNQRLPKGDWDVWLLEMGRGSGKTRTGAETVREWDESGVRRFALVARTTGDVRKTMLEGESGLLNIYPPGERPRFVGSANTVYFKSGAIAECFTDEVPDGLRGPQFEKSWSDETSSWRYLRKTWSNLLFATRLRGADGRNRPQHIVTCTPKRRRAYGEIFHNKNYPLKIVRSHGSSRDNIDNLADSFRRVIEAYAGTRLGRQEVEGVYSEEIEGALWSETNLDAYRVEHITLDMMTGGLVIAVDPAVSSTEKSAETGIVAVGRSTLEHAYVLGDFSGRMRPREWGEQVVCQYKRFKADKVVAEANQGGDLVAANVHAVDGNVPVELVHASRGKRVRAEPVATLYDRGLVHHVRFVDFGDGVLQPTHLEDLEDQMTSWDPNHAMDKEAIDDPEGDEREVASPDRVDANVWGVTYLFASDVGLWDALTKASNWDALLRS